MLQASQGDKIHLTRWLPGLLLSVLLLLLMISSAQYVFNSMLHHTNLHEPKNLPKCSHMCCHLCLKKMTEGGLKTIKCPQCNEVSNLPDDGVDGLITSLAIRNLAEKHPEGIKQRKEQLQQDFDQQKQQKTEMLKEEEEVIKQIQKSIEQEAKEVEKAVESVMMQAQELIQKIRDLGQAKLSKTEHKITQLKRQIQDIERSQTNLQTMADGEFHTETDRLVNQIEKLQINDSAKEKGDHCVCKFVAHNVELGRIVKPQRLELVQEFGEFESATGIVSKPNGMLAVWDESESDPEQVIVFRKENEEYQLQCKVIESDDLDASDIAVSADDRYLIAKDSGGFEVYSTDGNLQKAVSVTVDSKQPDVTCSITTTRDDRILVGSVFVGKGADPDKYFITVHDTAGNIVKTIPTSIPPLRIADIHGTHVAMSGFTKQDKVCVYDLQSGKETLNLDILLPLGICYDEESDCMLIGRATQRDENGSPVDGSYVIEQYCSVTGRLVAVLAQGLLFPGGMTITHDRMLAVTDGDTVKLYTMH